MINLSELRNEMTKAALELLETTLNKEINGGHHHE